MGNYAQQMYRSLLCLLKKPVGRVYYCIWGHWKVIRHCELRIIRVMWTWEGSLNKCAGRSEPKWWFHFLTIRAWWRTWCRLVYAYCESTILALVVWMELSVPFFWAHSAQGFRVDYNTMVTWKQQKRPQPNHFFYEYILDERSTWGYRQKRSVVLKSIRKVIWTSDIQTFSYYWYCSHYLWIKNI